MGFTGSAMDEKITLTKVSPVSWFVATEWCRQPFGKRGAIAGSVRSQKGPRGGEYA